MSRWRKQLGLVTAWALLGCSVAWAQARPVGETDAAAHIVATISAELREQLVLTPFYAKVVEVNGFAVLGSKQVSDYALLEAAYLIERMIGHRPDLLRALADSKTRFVVMAKNELTTDVPEHSDLRPARFWDRRARGLGATPQRPAVSCGEENLLGIPGDPYSSENILIHEFAHAIHHMGLARIDREFDAKLKIAFERAMKQGLWKGKYASSNRAEYWAEGVQSWFDTNRLPDHDHNHVNTREELKEYDPGLAALVEEVFGDGPWRYQAPRERKSVPHLQGLDLAQLGRFAWPEGLNEWYREYHRRKAGGKAPKQDSPNAAQREGQKK